MTLGSLVVVTCGYFTALANFDCLAHWHEFGPQAILPWIVKAGPTLDVLPTKSRWSKLIWQFGKFGDTP